MFSRFRGARAPQWFANGGECAAPFSLLFIPSGNSPPVWECAGHMELHPPPKFPPQYSSSFCSLCHGVRHCLQQFASPRTTKRTFPALAPLGRDMPRRRPLSVPSTINFDSYQGKLGDADKALPRLLGWVTEVNNLRVFPG